MSAIRKRFGARIKKLREARNLSQEKLAELANLHRTYIGDVERGERNIGLENIWKIARAFKMDLEELFKGL